MRIKFDEKYFMAKAIDEAKIALSMGESPFGQPEGIRSSVASESDSAQ